jgi:4'-phosphopantetheinyl transferase
MDVYWMEQTIGDLPESDDWLTEYEAIRLEGMRIPKRRNDWRLGRWTAKRVTAKYLGFPDEHPALREIEIRPAPFGAPEVFINQLRQPVSISLSHRDGRAMCALADHCVALGCDLEVIEPHSAAFIADYFTPREQSTVSETTDRDLFSSLLWSAKECALKALGIGLRVDTRCLQVQFELPPFRRGGWGWLQIRHVSGQMFEGWWQRSEELIRTLAADPRPSEPVGWQSTEMEAAALSAAFPVT